MSGGTVRVTAAQAVVRFLQAQWSERDGERRRAIPAMLGIFGHGNVCGLGQALAEDGDGLPLLAPKHEQAMVHAALGYAKATRRLATLACTASIGPGATNLVTGAATATTNRLPVLLLPGDTFASRRPGNVLQELEHPGYADWSVNECLRPVSRFFDRIARPEQLLAALPEAMRVLLDPLEAGAVTIALHQDAQGEAFDAPAGFFAERSWRVLRQPPEPAAVAAAAELLRHARRPLAIAGGGVVHSGAEAALARLADAHGVPVAETSAGKGACQGDAALGGIGVNGTRAANAVAAAADVVLCAGTRLSDFTTASRSLFQAPDVRFIGLNLDPRDAHKLGGLPLIGDARACLEALTGALGEWRAPEAHRAAAAEAIAGWRRELDDELGAGPPEPLTQGQALAELNAQARAGDWVVAAAGGPPGDLLKLWRAPRGSRAHLEFAFSCMGHEIPAGLGIRMAGAAGEVYVVIGDGTYLMASGDLVTAVQEGLKLTVLLLVNGGYMSIHALQRAMGAGALGTRFRGRDGRPLAVDYPAHARSMGCRARAAGDVAELREALAWARDGDGPALIAATVDPLRGLPASGAFWDLGLPAVSADPAVRRAAAAHARRRAAQRLYGWETA